MAEKTNKGGAQPDPNKSKRGGAQLNPVETAKLLKKLVGIIETEDINSLYELVKHIYTNGTAEEWEVLGAKTPFLSDYLASRVETRKDAKKERVEQLRSSRRSAEMRRLESESADSVKTQFDELAGTLSDADMRLLLGFWAGEQAIRQARKKTSAN